MMKVVKKSLFGQQQILGYLLPELNNGYSDNKPIK